MLVVPFAISACAMPRCWQSMRTRRVALRILAARMMPKTSDEPPVFTKDVRDAVQTAYRLRVSRLFEQEWNTMQVW